MCVVVTWLAFFIAGASPAQSQTESAEGYTFVTTERGPQICLGRWVPARDTGLPGYCDGQVLGLSQLTAISSKQSVDRLDQLLLALASIDQRLAVNNDQFGRLIEATVNTQTSIDKQVRQVSEFLREAITRSFEALPEEILADDVFKDALSKL